jgi:hypothetical protein
VTCGGALAELLSRLHRATLTPSAVVAHETGRRTPWRLRAANSAERCLIRLFGTRLRLVSILRHQGRGEASVTALDNRRLEDSNLRAPGHGAVTSADAMRRIRTGPLKFPRRTDRLAESSVA